MGAHMSAMGTSSTACANSIIQEEVMMIALENMGQEIGQFRWY